MPSQADQLLAVYGEAMQEHCFGVQVRIQRGGVAGDPVVAEVVTRDNVIEGERGQRNVVRVREYTIAVDRYRVDGVPVTPKPSDRLIEVDDAGNELLIVQVGNSKSDEPAVTHADDLRRKWQIKTFMLGQKS